MSFPGFARPLPTAVPKPSKAGKQVSKAPAKPLTAIENHTSHTSHTNHTNHQNHEDSLSKDSKQKETKPVVKEDTAKDRKVEKPEGMSELHDVALRARNIDGNLPLVLAKLVIFVGVILLDYAKQIPNNKRAQTVLKAVAAIAFCGLYPWFSLALFAGTGTVFLFSRLPKPEIPKQEGPK